MNGDLIEAYEMRITLNEDLEDIEEWVYTEEGETHEEDLEKIYLTKEKIEELKQKFIKRIQESENPFDIYTCDTDAFDKEMLLKYHGKLPELYKFPKGYVKSERK